MVHFDWKTTPHKRLIKKKKAFVAFHFFHPGCVSAVLALACFFFGLFRSTYSS